MFLYGEIFMRNLFIYANHANSQDLMVGMPEGMNAHPAIMDRRRRTGFLLTSLVTSFLQLLNDRYLQLGS